MRSDKFDSVTNNLRNSANGTFVASDDTFPLTQGRVVLRGDSVKDDSEYWTMIISITMGGCKNDGQEIKTSSVQDKQLTQYLLLPR